MSASPRIVIVGGGFAGVSAARTLLKSRRGIDLTVFARENHMVFQPLLAEVAGSSLNPRAVAAPLRLLLRGASVRTEEVLDVDLGTHELIHEGHDGQPRRMAFDHLVIACGNQVNLNLLPGMAAHALPLKTVGDAIALRAQVMQQLEKADAAEDPAQRARYLTYIVVGGGFSGVEVAGEINDLLRGTLRYYPRLKLADVRVTLVHGRDEILPEVSPPLRAFARERMQRAGVVVRTGKAVAEVSAAGVRLADGECIDGATVVCTVGTAPQTLVERLGVDKERGRLKTLPSMQLPASPRLWAIGDCAAVPNAHDGKLCPGTAQFAWRQGPQLARNLLRVLDGAPPQAFDFKAVGYAAGIGGHSGVAEFFGWRFSGFAAWWLWRSGFLVALPSLLQKLKVGFDWAWEILAPRDISHFKPALSDRVSRRHLAPGEVLLRRGQRPKASFAVEEGCVELASRRGADWMIETEFGPGSLLGEGTLADTEGDEAVLRARGAAEVLTVDDAALAQMSRVLQPLQALIQRAVSRPRRSIWRHHGAAMAALASRRAGQLASTQMVVQDEASPLGEAYLRLIDSRQPCVLGTSGGRLSGLASRSDLLAALARGCDRHSPLSDALNPRCLHLAADSPADQAAELMAEHGLKALPLVDADGAPCGLILADDIVKWALMQAR